MPIVIKRSSNSLVIHASKCSIMVVTTKQREAFNNLLNIDVCLGDDSLDQSNCIDYLGVQLDAQHGILRLMQSVRNFSSLFLGSAD